VSWDYGTLASEIYELDKPIGHSFGDTEYYMRLLSGVRGKQTTRFLRYDKWHDGSLLATELQLFRLQHWSLREFHNLLAQAGFTGIQVTADYHDDRPPALGSDQWTFHASRQ